MNAGGTTAGNVFTRRRCQFSLRLLLGAAVVATLPAWWFRPGSIKTEFSLSGFSIEFNQERKRVESIAHIRVTNMGPDSIWLHDGEYYVAFDIRPPFVAHKDGWEDVARGCYQGGYFGEEGHIRLKPAEFYDYSVTVDEDVAALQVTVKLFDRSGRSQREFKSPKFDVPNEL